MSPLPPIDKPTNSVLFDKIEKNFQGTAFGPDRWYILATATIVVGNDPELCRDLYLHIISKPEFSTPSQRQFLIRRMRETLVKCVSLAGVCKPFEAIIAINERERVEDKDYSATRGDWKCDIHNLERGIKWMGKIYTRDMKSTMDLYGDHKDFEWISKNITYRLYLSDRQILDDWQEL